MEPIELYLDVTTVSSDMVKYLETLFCCEMNFKANIIPVNIFGHKIIHKFSGSNSGRIFFTNSQKDEAFAFYFKYTEFVVGHNLNKLENNIL